LHAATIIRILRLQHQVVILDTLHATPQVVQVDGCQSVCQIVHRERTAVGLGSDRQHIADGYP
jgi:hypothetical protein